MSLDDLIEPVDPADTITVGASGLELSEHSCVQLPSYPKNGLPAPGTAGCLVRVTDSTRGLYLDTGAQWFPLNGRVVDAMEFGCKFDSDSTASVGTDDTEALQAALNAAGVGGAVLCPVGTAKVRNITIPAACALIGRGRHQTALVGAPGSTGVMVTDQGNAAKIILKDIAFYANKCDYNSVVKLGYNKFLWGTEGIIQNIWIRDCPGIGLDLNGNVGLVRGVSVWNIGTGVRATGNANMFHDIFVGDFTGYGIHADDSFWFGIELEAPRPGATPFYMSRQVAVLGIVISIGPGVVVTNLFEMEPRQAINNTIIGLTVYKTGTGDFRNTVCNDGLTFGKQEPFHEEVAFQYQKHFPQLVVVDEAYAKQRGYVITVKDVHPDIVFTMEPDLTRSVTFYFADRIANMQGRRYKIINNTERQIGFIRGVDSLYVRTNLLYTNINYDVSVGLPVRPRTFVEFQYAGYLCAIEVMAFMTHPELDLTDITQGKWWQGEIIRQKANLVGTTNELLKVCTATGYHVKGPWVQTSYAADDYVMNTGNVYRAVNAGISNGLGPIHTSGTATDGTVSWKYVDTASTAVFKTVTVS